MSVIEPQSPNGRLHLKRPRFNFRGLMKQVFPALIVVFGILQLYVFWYLFYTANLPILGCVSALAGTVLQIVGMIKLFEETRDGMRARRRMSLMIGLTLLWSWFFVYYGLLLVRHIFLV